MGYVLNDGTREYNELRGGSQEDGMVYTLGDQLSDCVVAEYILASSTLVYSTIKLKLMKKNMKNVQMPAPDKSGVCATCFYKFHDRSSKTGFYCIKLHEEVLLNGNC